jgi:V8-like Glu-specific endopeptidase
LTKYQSNIIYYDHIGVIKIKKENNDSYLPSGTGTLIGKAVVLTAYSAISDIIEY